MRWTDRVEYQSVWCVEGLERALVVAKVATSQCLNSALGIWLNVHDDVRVKEVRTLSCDAVIEQPILQSVA